MALLYAMSPEARRVAMRALYAGGLGLKQIGYRFGVTKQRVSAIIGAQGPRRPSGGERRRATVPAGGAAEPEAARDTLTGDPVLDRLRRGEAPGRIAQDLGLETDA